MQDNTIITHHADLPECPSTSETARPNRFYRQIIRHHKKDIMANNPHAGLTLQLVQQQKLVLSRLLTAVQLSQLIACDQGLNNLQTLLQYSTVALSLGLKESLELIQHERDYFVESLAKPILADSEEHGYTLTVASENLPRLNSLADFSVLPAEREEIEADLTLARQRLCQDHPLAQPPAAKVDSRLSPSSPATTHESTPSPFALDESGTRYQLSPVDLPTMAIPSPGAEMTLKSYSLPSIESELEFELFNFSRLHR